MDLAVHSARDPRFYMMVDVHELAATVAIDAPRNEFDRRRDPVAILAGTLFLVFDLDTLLECIDCFREIHGCCASVFCGFLSGG